MTVRQVSEAFREAMTGPILNTVALEFDNTVGKTNAALRALGIYTSVAYASGNFVGQGAMTWTTQASNQTTFEFLEQGISGTSGGASHLIHLHLVGTTVGGTLNTSLNVTVPNSRVILNTASGVYSFRDNGSYGVGVWEALASGVVIKFYKTDKTVNWTASTGATDIRATIALSIL